jgi:hypothetical protein
MTWSYDETLVEPKDQLRLMIGDVDVADVNNHLMSDEGIMFFLASEGGNVYEAAAVIAEALAMRFATTVQKSVGSMSISAQQKYEHYLELAKMLRARADLYVNARPLVGGISKADKATQESDPDRVVPAFSVKLFDVPSAQPLGGGRSGPGEEW